MIRSTSTNVVNTDLANKLRKAVGAVTRNDDNRAKIGAGEVNLNAYYERLFLSCDDK